MRTLRALLAFQIVVGLLFALGIRCDARGPEARCRSNLLRIWEALDLYRATRNESGPDAGGHEFLESLELADAVSICPADPEGRAYWVFDNRYHSRDVSRLDAIGGKAIAAPIVADRDLFHDGFLLVLYADGHIAPLARTDAEYSYFAERFRDGTPMPGW